MPYLTLADGETLYYKTWGPATGPAVTLSHGWPLNSDAWEQQMFLLASHGCRVIAHDRRGHGRSSQPSHGSNMATYADDQHQVIEDLDLKDILMIGHSTGGGKVAKYIGTFGSPRVAKVVLIGAVTPLMLQTDANPDCVPKDVLDGFRAVMLHDRAHFFHDVASGPFFGSNREGVRVSQRQL